MWVGTIQLAESSDRTKRLNKTKKAVERLILHLSLELGLFSSLPLRIRTPGSLAFDIHNLYQWRAEFSGLQPQTENLIITFLVLKHSGLDWVTLLAFLILWLADNISWDFSAFIILWENSLNKSLLIYQSIYLSIIYYLFLYLSCIYSIGCVSLEIPNQYNWQWFYNSWARYCKGVCIPN